MMAGLGARPNPQTLLDDALTGARFVWGLQRHLRRPISLPEARATIRQRLERREADFLARTRNAIYANQGSPYLQLLRLAGCEYGDLERLVEQEGLEGALRELFERGVYLTVEEFKGRRPAVRGSATIEVDPTALRNPTSVVHVLMQSSGSRGARRPVPYDLDYMRAIANDRLVFEDARGGANMTRAIWAVPGGTAVGYFLLYGSFRAVPARWFSQVDAGASGLDRRYEWSVHALRLGALLAGLRLPGPEHVPVDNPLPIARWMAACLAAGRVPHLATFSSSAARLCQAATEAGIDLAGAQFTVGGEPLTEALLATIRASGAAVGSGYGSMEVGAVAYTCLQGELADDSHVLTDLNAVIQAGQLGPERQLPATALLFTALRPSAAFVLLNASTGDQADMDERACGCPLAAVGWATHLRAIRSFEKLTAGGMTFLDTDVIRILEAGLPARFGGGPAAYQLVEEQGVGGQPRLSLRVHPVVGPLDEGAVAAAFLELLGEASPAGRVMALQWRDAGVLRVERAAPLATGSGKILHLHQATAPASAPR